MAMAATALKDMLSISIKSRHDSYSDQYNRIFMVKLFLIGSVITGVSWYTDSLTCMIPGKFYFWPPPVATVLCCRTFKNKTRVQHSYLHDVILFLCM